MYQLIETYHSIVKNIDEGKSCCIVFCDLSKAFDRVWHEGFFLNYKLTVFVSCHKHLGLTLFDDLKWSVYINDIVSNACKKLGLLKKLKFTLGIDKLSKLYITFIRPILEYASVVWDGCSSAEIKKLKKYSYTLQELSRDFQFWPQGNHCISKRVGTLYLKEGK